MSTIIPKYLDHDQVLAKQAPINGEISLAKLERFDHMLNDLGSIVNCTLLFYKENDELFLRLTVQTALTLQCQRCLEDYSHHINSKNVLKIISVQEELEVEEEHALIQDGKLDLFSIIADEIILSIPISPMHELEACENDLIKKYADNALASEKKYPFTVLKSLKK